MRRPWALALAIAVPLGARAASPGGPIVAHRLEGTLRIDGRLDEGAWALAQPFDAFVQTFPDEGEAPSERTRVRVLYDDRALYVGVECDDAAPDAMVRTLGRRDGAPFSDYLYVFVDSMRDRRAAYFFGLSASGVQDDGIVYDDDRFDLQWDAAWRGEVADTPGGWSAELEIPLSALRFSDAPEQAWGFGVKRLLARRHEESATSLVRRNERGIVPRLGPLVGLRDLGPPRELEVVPYLAVRAVARPESPDAARPRVVDPEGDVGLDLKAGIGTLALQATVNPDFGQVEADQLVQNLTRYELAFPEKRPFFLQGMELFRPVASAQDGTTPQQLFYSRRIGLDTPILGAAKVSGQLGDLQLGLLDAFVDGAPGGAGWDDSRPLHLASSRAPPAEPFVPENFLAAVARWRAAPGATFGATFTSALPTGAGCTEADLDEAAAAGVLPPARCRPLAGNAAAADWDLRTGDAGWFLRGQLTGSQHLGAAPRLVLVDGTVLERGDLGWGAFASAGRQAGEPWRFDVAWEYESPRLALDALGFLRTQNEQAISARAAYVRPSGGGPLHAWEVGVAAEARVTTDGRGLGRGRKASAWAEAALRSYEVVRCGADLALAAWDVREITATGIAYERPAAWRAECRLSTDSGRPVRLAAVVGGGKTVAAGPYPAMGGWDATVTAVVRPHPRLESRTDVRYVDVRQPARWVDVAGAAPGTLWFADLHAPSLSVTLREQLVLTPRLTLQVYAQLFTSPYDYGRTYASAVPAGSRLVRPGDLVPTAAPAAGPADLREVTLNLNAVLRWEYQPGSTVFVVYAREQRPPPGETGASLAPGAIGQGPATDTLLLKWTYRFAR